MRRRISRIALLTVMLGSLIGAGGAQAAASSGPQLPQPYVSVASRTIVPPGFSIDADQALQLVKDNPAMQSLHKRDHPLQFYIGIWRNPVSWWVQFTYHSKVVASVYVTPHGKVRAVWTGPLAIAEYARGHYAPIFDSPWVVITFSVLFLIPFLDRRRLRSWLLLDGLVLLSFMVSYGLFDATHLEAAVWAAYPPMIYLVARLLMIGFGRARGGSLPTWIPTKALALGLLGLVVARSVLSLVDHTIIDVGFASVIGASRLAHGQALYYLNAQHGDTYGPVNYLLYLPFELIWPYDGKWDYLASAHVAALFFDLATIGGLVQFGRKLRPGEQGLRLGLTLGWAYAASPLTLLCLMMHSNDEMIAMFGVLTLLVLRSAPGRGLVLGLAAAAKFSPAGLLPLIAVGRRGSRNDAIRVVVVFAAIIAVTVGLYLPPGGITEFWNHTIGFQLSRSDVFSPWALHSSLNPIKDLLELFAVGLALGVAVFPRRERSVVEIAALAGAITIAIQMPAIHWFYYYIVWFMPFALIAFFGGREASPPAESADEGVLEPVTVDGPVRLPVAAAIANAR